MSSGGDVLKVVAVGGNIGSLLGPYARCLYRPH